MNKVKTVSDSWPSEPAEKDFEIVDSSTITLYSDILKGVGGNSLLNYISEVE